MLLCVCFPKPFWQSRFRAHGLALEVDITTEEIRPGLHMPYLLPSTFFGHLGMIGWIGVLLGGMSPEEAKPVLTVFWDRCKKQFPTHQMFKSNSNLNLAQTIPFYGHIDEGRGHKNKGVCLCNSHSVIGKGSTPFLKRHVFKEHLKKQKMGLNMIGHTSATRLLHFAIPKRVYGQHAIAYTTAVSTMVREWKQLQVEGFKVLNGNRTEVWHAVFLGLKADLPAHISTGGLNRHHDCTYGNVFVYYISCVLFSTGIMLKITLQSIKVRLGMSLRRTAKMNALAFVTWT